jgi:hypothetical protein
MRKGKSKESPNPSSASPESYVNEKRKMGSPAENVELLYEYFPLSLDDW